MYLEVKSDKRGNLGNQNVFANTDIRYRKKERPHQQPRGQPLSKTSKDNVVAFKKKPIKSEQLNGKGLQVITSISTRPGYKSLSMIILGYQRISQDS